jgi:hypothetical protein
LLLYITIAGPTAIIRPHLYSLLLTLAPGRALGIGPGYPAVLQKGAFCASKNGLLAYFRKSPQLHSFRYQSLATARSQPNLRERQCTDAWIYTERGPVPSLPLRRTLLTKPKKSGKMRESGRHIAFRFNSALSPAVWPWNCARGRPQSSTNGSGELIHREPPAAKVKTPSSVGDVL